MPPQSHFLCDGFKRLIVENSLNGLGASNELGQRIRGMKSFVEIDESI